GVHLKFSGHYRGINELEKVGLSGRLLSLVLGLSLSVFGFSILFKLFIFAMHKYIPSKS
ncbi:hypothetical protein ABTC21_18505, partial [Acinetobacter baumannii]